MDARENCFLADDTVVDEILRWSSEDPRHVLGVRNPPLLEKGDGWELFDRR